MAEKAYIEREAVNAVLAEECSPKVAAYLTDAVAAIPAADARPVRKGKWVKDISRFFEVPVSWHCSECGKTIGYGFSEGNPNFCPNCGADMRATPKEE